MAAPRFRIIPRSEWGARHGRGRNVTGNLPWDEVVIHTEAGAVRPQDWPEITRAALVMSLSEQQHIQAVERYHAVTLGWDGVGYSFLISRDGSIFEGRGWGRSGSHTETRNSTAAGICFLGHGDLQPATEAQWLAAEWLISEGTRLGHLTPTPAITGHRNYSTKGKTCPGALIYPHIGRLRRTTTRPTPVAPQSEEDTTMVIGRQNHHWRILICPDGTAIAGPDMGGSRTPDIVLTEPAWDRLVKHFGKRLVRLG